MPAPGDEGAEGSAGARPEEERGCGWGPPAQQHRKGRTGPSGGTKKEKDAEETTPHGQCPAGAEGRVVADSAEETTGGNHGLTRKGESGRRTKGGHAAKSADRERTAQQPKETPQRHRTATKLAAQAGGAVRGPYRSPAPSGQCGTAAPCDRGRRRKARRRMPQNSTAARPATQGTGWRAKPHGPRVLRSGAGRRIVAADSRRAKAKGKEGHTAPTPARPPAARDPDGAESWQMTQ